MSEYEKLTDEELEKLLEKGRYWLASNRIDSRYDQQLDKFCEAWAVRYDRREQKKKNMKKLF